MAYRTFIRASASPRAVHELHRFDGIRFYRSEFPAGSWETYSYPRPVKYSEAPTLHIQTAGSVIEPSGTWPAHAAGWMSREDGFVIPAGAWTRLASTDAVRWCCLGRHDEDIVDYVDSIRLADGGVLEMAQGGSVLPVSGALRCGDATIPAGIRAACKTGPKALTAQGDVLAFVWNRRDS